MEQYFNIKCSCGVNEVIIENIIHWNEDESCKCHGCGSRLMRKRNTNSCGWDFSDAPNKIVIDGGCDE
ncbi:hypothetical protein ZP9_00048 [Shewanella phage ZP9]|nr:hypothetical protein ZP9_00048 [Shewanella phage ZP9]